jgi:hypothetical protein
MADWKDVGADDGWNDVGWEDVGGDSGFTKALGVGEAALGTASSLFSAIPQGIRALGELAVTGDLSTALERAESSGDLLTYKPRTKTGKDLTKGVMDTLHDYQQEVGTKFSGDTGYLAKKKMDQGKLSSGDLQAENTERFVGELIGGVFVPGIGSVGRKPKAKVSDKTLDGIQQKQAEIDARNAPVEKPYEPPVNIREELGLHEDGPRNGIPATRVEAMLGGKESLPNRDFLEASREREAVAVQRRQQAEQRAAAEQQAAREHALKLYDKELQDRLSDLNDRINSGETNASILKEFQDLVDKYRRRRAQEEIEARQRDLELSVRQAMDPRLLFQEMRDRSGKPAEETPVGRFELDPQARDAHGLVPEQLGRDMTRQEQTPVPGVDEVISRANQEAAVDPSVQAAEAKVPGVEERAVDSGAYGDMHAKFMEESLRVAEQNVETLKEQISGDRRADPLNLGQPRYIRKGQRGAVGNLNPGKKSRTIIDDLRDRFGKQKGDDSFVSPDPDPAQTLKEAKGQSDGRGINVLESGGVLAAMKRGSALVRDGVRLVQNALKRADRKIRDNVFPVEKALRSLKKEEITSLAGIMKAEMLQGKRFDVEALESQLNPTQLAAYSHMRSMFEDTLRIQNEKRDVAQGKKPITEMEAYLSSRWDGDFRRPVYQAVLDRHGNPKINEKGEIEKKLVWYLAAHTKRGLEKQWEALKKDRPDLTYEESMDHVVKYFKRETDLQAVYPTIVDILGRDDPAVMLLKEAVEQQSINEAATFLGQEKHFKEKTGVRGFVGDRPGKRGTFEESLAMFQQQIQYAKNAYKWSEMQTAGEGLKKLFSDPDIAKAQPNNVKYLKDYFKTNIGYGEHHAISRLEDSVRGLGFSPSLMNEAVGGSKTFFIMQKLLANTGYMLSGVLQPANVLPHFTALWGQKVFGNPITASVAGLLGGTSLALGHYGNLATGGKLGRGIQLDSPFYKKAFRYAEDNGVTARSLMDESPIESSFSKVKRTADFAAKLTMVPPEVVGRSIAYMAYVEFLRSSGKFKGRDLELFQKAEELVNASMVDYRAGERPMIFSKLGTIGNFLNTLQTYPVNWYNQWNYFARQLGKGNPLPIMTAFATQYAMAGAMGVPGFSDMDKLYQMAKDHVVSNQTYASMRDHPFWNDPKVWMMQHFGDESVYGWLSDATGIGITSRIAAPSAGDMIQAPGGPVVDIVKQGMNLGKAALDPTNPDKWAQSAMSTVPPGTQGFLEQLPFMEGLTYEKRANGDIVPQRPGDITDHRGVTVRTPQEQIIRNFGLRSQRETVDRELGYRADRDERTGQSRGREMIDEIYAAAKRGNREKVKDLYTAYVKLTGNRISREAWKAQIEQNYMSTMERRGKKASRLPIVDLKAIGRIQSILDELENENK